MDTDCFLEGAMYRLIVFFVLLLAGSNVFALEIEWKVDHPFRYFYQKSDLAIHQWAYQELLNENPDQAKFAPISHMERKLNKYGWWNKERLEKLRALRRKEGKSDILDIRQGWGSLLTSSAPEARGEIDGTCWNAKTQRHDNCEGKRQSELHGTTGRPERLKGRPYYFKRGTYLYPKFHRVTISLDDPPSETCIWTADDEIFLGEDNSEMKTITENCGDAVRARIKYEPDSDGVDVRVSVAGKSEESINIQVRDILIFALGDSYSSGEGNPEIPAKLHKFRAITSVIPNGENPARLTRKQKFGAPRRFPVGASSAAIWTDRRCHRSIYSYQTRVALQLAIAAGRNGKHHHAVTYYQFTCSGAEVTEDILYAWEGKECIGKAKSTRKPGPNHPFYMPQISKASLALCQYHGNPVAEKWRLSKIAGDSAKIYEKDHYLRYRSELISKQNTSRQACRFKRGRNVGDNPNLWYCRKNRRIRKIDLLLTSAGGNDVGFSKIIANIIATTKLVEFIRKSPFSKQFFVDENEAENRLGYLRNRLNTYNLALDKFLGVSAKGDGKPIIAMLYPNMIYKNADQGPNRFCPGGNTVMDVSKFLALDRSKLQSVENIIEGKKKPSGEGYDGLIQTIRRKGAAMKWSLVDGHREAFKSHGLCASDMGASPNESGTGSAEIQGIPYKIVDFSKNGNEAQNSRRWLRFDPVKDYYPYESRKTWFRSPNQDYLNIHYFKDIMPKGWKRKNKASALAITQRILGGSFHPTAEGHAHIADYVYCKAREQLFEKKCEDKNVTTYAHRW